MQTISVPNKKLAYTINIFLILAIILTVYSLFIFFTFTTMMRVEAVVVGVLKEYVSAYEVYHYLASFKTAIFFVRLLSLFGMILILIYIDRLSVFQLQHEQTHETVGRVVFWSKVKLLLLFLMLCVSVFI